MAVKISLLSLVHSKSIYVLHVKYAEYHKSYLDYFFYWLITRYNEEKSRMEKIGRTRVSKREKI